MLRALAFDVDVELPFPFLFAYARHYGWAVLLGYTSAFTQEVSDRRLMASFSRETAEYALRLASDCLLDAKVLQFPAPVVAAGSLRLASLVLDDAGECARGKWWYECDTRFVRPQSLLSQQYVELM